MNDRSLQNTIIIGCFAMVTIVTGAWVLEAGKSTIQTHQHRRTEAFCKVDPSYCNPQPDHVD